MKVAMLVLLGLLAGGRAAAHSVSDAYLTLTADGAGANRILHGQWDIALRDLDFVLGLDESGQGRLTWADVRRRQPQIEAYAYGHLKFLAGVSSRCSIKPVKQMIDQHADGAYAALFFDVACASDLPASGLEYSLFFGVDPSHRAIFVRRSGSDVATAVLGPQNAKIDLH